MRKTGRRKSVRHLGITFFAAIAAFALLFLVPSSSRSPASSSPAALPAQAGRVVKIDVSSQKLRLYQDRRLLREYAVSTSKYGIGSTAGSNKTPLGRHVIAKKIGKNAPLGTIFKSRSDTGTVAALNLAKHPAGEDFVTSRILWLDGLEPGANKGKGVDSYSRDIYIHGTADEGLIGTPASHGCIRMKNQEVIELFDLVEEGTPVEIQE